MAGGPMCRSCGKRPGRPDGDSRSDDAGRAVRAVHGAPQRAHPPQPRRRARAPLLATILSSSASKRAGERQPTRCALDGSDAAAAAAGLRHHRAAVAVDGTPPSKLMPSCAPYMYQYDGQRSPTGVPAGQSTGPTRVDVVEHRARRSAVVGRRGDGGVVGLGTATSRRRRRRRARRRIAPGRGCRWGRASARCCCRRRWRRERRRARRRRAPRRRCACSSCRRRRRRCRASGPTLRWWRRACTSRSRSCRRPTNAAAPGA